MTRSHAHRVRPPEPERLALTDVAAFLVGMTFIIALLVIVLASGPLPT